MTQLYTSKRTAIKYPSGKNPAIFSKIHWIPGSYNLDNGGGPHDEPSHFLLENFGVFNLVYDPFNRTPDHNAHVLNMLKLLKKVHTSTLSNVLNVIHTPEDRLAAMEFSAQHTETIYISIYSGNKSGVGALTRKDCWQENRTIDTYIPEALQVFDSVIFDRRLKALVCHNTRRSF